MVRPADLLLVLTDDQRRRLGAAGVARVDGVVAADAAAGMAEAVWASLARTGVDRVDRSTWPSGFVGKHQALRKARAFDGFANERTAAVLDELLGVGRWRDGGGWGPGLVTFPEPGPWTVPHGVWHFDLPARGDPDQPAVARLFGYLTAVVPRGGGTLVVEGSHELVRRMVAAAPDHDAGSSADVRKRLVREHEWFRALCREGGDRVRQFMEDGDEIDGVRVRVVELTAEAGDVAVMLPWTLHNLSMNVADQPRFMVTHSVHRQPAAA